jgi:allantoinase
VHLNAPGREQWEGFKTGTQAAASGGVTTVVDMPLNSIPSTTTTSNLKAKTDRATGACHVDIAFWGGVVPDNAEDLVPLVNAGVKGFKCFLCNSGVDEFRHVEEADLHKALPKIQHSGRKMLFHAELGDRDEESTHNHRNYSTFLKTSPESMEESAIALVARLTEQYAPLQTHIVHLSASSALPIIREARREKKLPMSVETCIHYLTLEAETVPEGRTDYKCCPPIRGRENRDALWQALIDGDIDFIVSDHSPCTADLKRLGEGNFLKAWGGIGGLGLGISLLYTECQKRNISICKLVEWMSSKPAAWIGIDKLKGGIREGADGDFVIFDTSRSFTVSQAQSSFVTKLY